MRTSRSGRWTRRQRRERGSCIGLLTGKLRRDDLRLLAYPSLCVALACGGIVNLLLKAHVGRARPDTLAEFGGTAQFTPPWQIVDECARNCSFTSGAAAMAASLAIPTLVILWSHLTRDHGRLLAIMVAVGYIAVTSLLRIGLGRHFLSDTLFSVALLPAWRWRFILSCGSPRPGDICPFWPRARH